MESCSQNHFKIFLKLLILFFLVLWTLQPYPVLPRPVWTLWKASLCRHFVICDMPSVWQSEQWSHSVGALRAISSRSLCTMYVCMYYYCCQEGLMACCGAAGWGSALTLLKVLLLALQVHWGMWLGWSFTRHIWTFPELPWDGLDVNSCKRGVRHGVVTRSTSSKLMTLEPRGAGLRRRLHRGRAAGPHQPCSPPHPAARWPGMAPGPG